VGPYQRRPKWTIGFAALNPPAKGANHLRVGVPCPALGPFVASSR
jgi:hypothetical protein